MRSAFWPTAMTTVSQGIVSSERDRDRGAPTVGRGRSELHGLDPQPLDVPVSDDLQRGLQEQESDPLLLGAVDLLGIRRHLRPVRR